VVLLAGCGATARLVPGYVDAARLARYHPGQPALRALSDMTAQVERDLARLQRGQTLPLPPASVTMPPLPAQPLPAAPVGQAVAVARAGAQADLARLEQEIRRGTEEKIARRREAVMTTVRLEIARERARREEQLWQDKLQITQPHSQDLTNLELEVGNLRRMLARGAVLPGQEQATQAALRDADARLSALRKDLDSRITALEARYASEIEQYAASARAAAEREVAAYREEQLSQVSAQVAEARRRMEQGLTGVEQSAGRVVGIQAGPAPTLDLSPVRARIAAAQAVARRDRGQGIVALRAELTRLQRQRQELSRAIAADTRDTVSAIMRSRGVRVSFSRRAASLMRNRTPQALQAVRAFWGPAAGREE